MAPRIVFLHDVPMPNRKAATLQIVSTAAALAERGTRCEFLHGRRHEPAEATLGALGVQPRDSLALREFFSRPRWLPATIRNLRLARRLAAECEDLETVVVARGEAGMDLLPHLARLRRDGRGPTLLYEVHRLAGTSVQETEQGSARDGSAPLEADAQRAQKRDLAAANAADGHVFLTAAVAAAARDTGFPARPSIILPSGTTVPDRLPATGEQTLDVVYAGKLEARKGVPDLLAVMRMLPNHTLDIAGGGEDEVAVARHDAPANVRFHGWLDQASVSKLLSRGRVGACLLPTGVDSVSDRFSSPMKLLQMMAHGLPVVATRNEAVEAIASDGVNAVLVPPGDHAAAADAIARLLKSEADRDRLGAAARARASEFAWAKRAAKLDAFAGQVLRDRLPVRSAEHA